MFRNLNIAEVGRGLVPNRWKRNAFSHQRCILGDDAEVDCDTSASI